MKQTATFLTSEQMEIISNDLADLVAKIEILNDADKNDFDDLKRIIKTEIQDSITETRVKEKIAEENFELEDNLNELKKVRSNFARCSKIRFWKILATIFVSNLFLIPLTMIFTKYLIEFGIIN